MLSRLIVAFGIAASLLPIAANAADRPIVVELFTSQGCSSCPPANAFLNEPIQGSPGSAAVSLSRYLLGRPGMERSILATGSD